MQSRPLGDLLCVVVSRQEVESLDTGPALSVLRRLLETPQTALAHMEGVDIAFHGYDDDPRELSEVPEVRDYVHALDEQFPFWLFFLSKQGLGLQCLTFCFLLPFLTDEAKARRHPQQLGELLTSRWVPALNHVVGYAGLSEEQTDRLTDQALTYLMHGPRPA